MGKLFISHSSKDRVSAAFSPDGARLVTASNDNIARIWQVLPTRDRLVDFAHTRAYRALTLEERREYGLPAGSHRAARPVML